MELFADMQENSLVPNPLPLDDHSEGDLGNCVCIFCTVTSQSHAITMRSAYRVCRTYAPSGCGNCLLLYL